MRGSGPVQAADANPFSRVVKVGWWVTNQSDQAIQLWDCNAVAFDRNGEELFRLPTLSFRDFFLPPGGGNGTVTDDPYGGPNSASFEWGELPGVSPHEATAAHRYEGTCSAWEWIGPIPGPPEGV